MRKSVRLAPPKHDVCRLRPALLACFCLLAFLSVATAQPQPTPFRFGEVDLEFLDQTQQLDKKFEDQGLVYHEPELNAFVNRVGEVAEQQGHHPDILLTWGKAEITMWTHKIDGLTRSDLIMAAKIDQLYSG